MSTNEFCAGCGASLSGNERFCTNCGKARVSAQPTTTDPFAQAPTPETVTFQTPPPAPRKPINKKLVAMILAPILVLTLGIGGYWFAFMRLNYSATTVLQLVGNNQGRADTLVSNSCPTLKKLVNSVSLDISTTQFAILLDYTAALDLEDDYSTTLTTEITKWGRNTLTQEFGGRSTKIKYLPAVSKDLYNQAKSKCGLNSEVSTLESDARALDTKISDIKYPGSWQPSGYYQSDEDPNIAWKWAPDYSYSCGYYTDGCIRLYVITNQKCQGSIDVELGLMYTSGGSIQDYEYGYLENVQKGRVYGLTVNHYGYEYDWWRVSSISCDN